MYRLRLFRRLAGALRDDAVHADPGGSGNGGTDAPPVLPLWRGEYSRQGGKDKRLLLRNGRGESCKGQE